MVWDIAEQEAHYGEAPVVRERVALALKGIYWWMTVGLMVTAFVSLGMIETGLVLELVDSVGLYVGLLVLEVLVVIGLTAGLSRMSPRTAAASFVFYAALNGATLSILALIYTGASIASTFFVTAGTFAVMAGYGTLTRRSLAGWGSFLLMGLVGLVLVGIVNLFLRSPAVHWVLGAVGVLVFTGLSAYDANKLRRMAEDGVMPLDKLEIYGALVLYLDFVNLFLYLLRFLGRRK